MTTATDLDLTHLQERPLVRIVIIGHVDHGKSTLIGRLLHETDSLPAGKLEALKAVSARRGMPFEWSFILDSLQTERDQGITIDTSQIRFRTASRDFVLIDAPGHAQFLRNMITGAAQADAALLVVDAVDGIRDQTRRHAYLLHLLDVRQIVVAINKMDSVGYDPARFAALSADIRSYLGELGLSAAAIVPVSAREGDGIAARTPAISWHDGPTISEALDRFVAVAATTERPLRLPVQAVYKFDERRIVAGRLESGRICVGDEIVVGPAGVTARIRSIEAWPAPSGRDAPRTAHAGQSVGVTLDRDLFVSRGDVLAPAAQPAGVAAVLRSRIFWLHPQPLRPGAALTLRVGTAETRATVSAITETLDPGELARRQDGLLAANQIGDVTFVLARPVALDLHSDNPRTGRIALEYDGAIMGGGLVTSFDPPPRTAASDIVPNIPEISLEARARRLGHRGAVVWLTGLPGSGKSTIANALERRLLDRAMVPVVLDGDTLRAGLNSDLGFSDADRTENLRRIAEVAALLARQGLMAIVAAVSPLAAARAHARRVVGDGFIEVYLAPPAEVCEQRDPKGHYRKARAGGIADFTGITGQYEVPQFAELVIDTSQRTVQASVDAILEKLLVAAGAPSSPAAQR